MINVGCLWITVACFPFQIVTAAWVPSIRKICLLINLWYLLINQYKHVLDKQIQVKGKIASVSREASLRTFKSICTAVCTHCREPHYLGRAEQNLQAHVFSHQAIGAIPPSVLKLSYLWMRRLVTIRYLHLQSYSKASGPGSLVKPSKDLPNRCKALGSISRHGKQKEKRNWPMVSSCISYYFHIYKTLQAQKIYTSLFLREQEYRNLGGQLKACSPSSAHHGLSVFKTPPAGYRLTSRAHSSSPHHLQWSLKQCSKCTRSLENLCRMNEYVNSSHQFENLSLQLLILLIF